MPNMEMVRRLMKLPAFLQPRHAHLFTEHSRPPLEDKPTVLLVDDEPAIRALLAASLRHCGYTAFEAADGAEAVKLAGAATRLDVVVSDIRMPHMDGFEMAEILRKSRPGLNIVFVSGYPVDHPRIGPGTQILTKPFLQTNLLRAVQQAAPLLQQPVITA